MLAVYLIFSFIFGLIIGSFLNAVVYRLYKGKSLLGFSFCPHCKHRLHPIDLVPIFSFIWQRGKCRYCHKAISWQYPLVEAAVAAIFILITRDYLLAEGLSLSGPKFIELILLFAIAAILVGIFVFDLRYYLIPDVLVIAGIVTTILWRFFGVGHFLQGFFGALIVSGFFGLLFLISSGKWIGLGDVKLALFLGFFLGIKFSLLMLLVAYVSGAIIGIILVLIKRRTLSGVLPFGTFLTASTLVVMLWGNEILTWYFGIL